MKSFSWVRAVCGRNMRGLWLLTATRCATALIAVAYALLMQRTIDAAVAGNAPAFWAGLAAFAAALLSVTALSALTKYLTEAVQAKIENTLREHVVASIVQAGRLPHGRASGEVASVLTSDVTAVAESVVSIVPEAASMLVRAVAALALMFAVAPALAAFFVAAGSACVVVSLGIRRWLKRKHERAQATEATMRSRLQEVLESLVIVRSFGAQERALGGLRVLMDGHLRARKGRAGGKAVSGTVFNLAMQLSYLAGFGYGCWGILTGQVSYGTLMALVQLVGQVRAPFASLSGLLPQAAALSASCERLQAIEPPMRALKAPAAGAEFESLCFNNVTFAYAKAKGAAPVGFAEAKGHGGAGPSTGAANNGVMGTGTGTTNGPSSNADTAPEAGAVREDVLRNFSAEVRAGEFVAVTGPSGIGKSTMLMLALGMEEPREGKVEVAFSDGSTYAAAELAPGTFAYVPQGNMLMSGTIREAICFAKAPTAQQGATSVEGTCSASDAKQGTTAHASTATTRSVSDACPQAACHATGIEDTVDNAGPYVARHSAYTEDATDDVRLRAACHAACVDEFIVKLPHGYETQLGEKGSGLSEGQMQRLAVARAVYSGAPVLLLDECTSALDEPTEQEMLKRLRGLSKTIITITHRPAALSLCDRMLRIGEK